MSRSAATQTGSNLTERLHVLSDMTRLRLLTLLATNELTVGELASTMQLPQSTASRHLKILLNSGWIGRRTHGTSSRYWFETDDLSSEFLDLWVPINAQLVDSPQVRQDQHRLTQVLSERRFDTMAFFGQVGSEWDVMRTELFGRIFADEALLALLPNSWVIADLGCGTGDLSAKIAPHVAQVIAVDMSDEMLTAARKRLGANDNIAFYEADLMHLPIETAAVDAACISLVLHHVTDPEAAIAEAIRIVKPGSGRLLIIDMLQHDRAEYKHTMGHQHLGFTTTEITNWMECNGLVDIQIKTLTSPPDAMGPELLVASGTRR